MSIKNFEKFEELIKEMPKEEIMEEMNITESEFEMYVEELEKEYSSINKIHRGNVDELINSSLDISSMILKGVGYLSTKFIEVEDVNLYIKNYVTLTKPMLENLGINDLLKMKNVEDMSLTEKLVITGIYMSAMLYIAKQATSMQLRTMAS